MQGHLMVYPYTIGADGSVSYLGTELIPDTKVHCPCVMCLLGSKACWPSLLLPAASTVSTTRCAFLYTPFGQRQHGISQMLLPQRLSCRPSGELLFRPLCCSCNPQTALVLGKKSTTLPCQLTT